MHCSNWTCSQLTREYNFIKIIFLLVSSPLEIYFPLKLNTLVGIKYMILEAKQFNS